MSAKGLAFGQNSRDSRDTQSQSPLSPFACIDDGSLDRHDDQSNRTVGILMWLREETLESAEPPEPWRCKPDKRNCLKGDASSKRGLIGLYWIMTGLR